MKNAYSGNVRPPSMCLRDSLLMTVFNDSWLNLGVISRESSRGGSLIAIPDSYNSHSCFRQGRQDYTMKFLFPSLQIGFIHRIKEYLATTKVNRSSVLIQIVPADNERTTWKFCDHDASGNKEARP